MAAPVAFAGALAPSPRDRSARASSSSRARAAAPPPSGRPRLGRVIRSSSSPRDAHASHDESDESAGPPLGVVLTHVSADFDTLSSAVGLAKLRDHRLGAQCTCVVLPRGASPGVSHYLALHKNKFPIKEFRAVDASRLEWVGVVDAQRRDRLADCASWLDDAKDVVVVDHHALATSDIDATERIIQEVGATATVVAEMLEAEDVKITEEDATLLGLGIHTDTGSLTFEATTPRDAKALAYCLERGASQKVLAEYVNPNLTPEQREVIARGLGSTRQTEAEGLTIAAVNVECDEYTPGMATCAKELLDLTDSDVLFMAVSYVHGKKNPYRHVSVIGRAKPVKTVDLGEVLTNAFAGGGHPKAASAAFRMDQELKTVDANPELEARRVAGDIDGILDVLVGTVVATQVPPQKTAGDVMKRAANVVSARPSMTMGEVGGLLEREHGHRSCPVISDDGVLVGVVSITEVDVAAIKGQLDRPVSGYMKLRSAVTLTTPVSECERILVENGEGCIPVVANYEDDKKAWKLAGLVTRATILNTHEYYRSKRMSGGRGFKGPPPKTKFNEVFFAEDVLSMDSIDDVEAALSAQERESLEALLPREGDKGTTSEEAS